MNDRRSYTITIISFFQSIFPDFPPSIFKSIWKHFLQVTFYEFLLFSFKNSKFLKGIWSHLQKILKKKPQHKGKLMLSCDRRSFTIIDRIVSHDHSRSWSLGLKKYEPHSLMITHVHGAITLGVLASLGFHKIYSIEHLKNHNIFENMTFIQ